MYLLCRRPLAHYYARFGFEEIGLREAPWVLKVKLGMANLLGALLGIRLAAMRRGVCERLKVRP